MRSDEERRFIQWLKTQHDSKGKLFSLSRCKHYVNSIKSAVPRLILPKLLDSDEAFGCRTLEEFDIMRQMFLKAPNYEDVNLKASNGAFFAGLSALRRYFEHLESSGDRHNETTQNQAKNVPLPSEIVANSADNVDFSQPKKYAFTDPLECSINGKFITGKNGWNWRDLLIAVAEYFLSTDPHSLDSLILKSGRSFMTSQKYEDLSMAEYRKLTNGYLVVVSFDIPSLVTQIGNLCLHCGVSLDEVVITYKHKNKSNKPRSNDESDVKSPMPSRCFIVLPNGMQLNPEEVIDLKEAKEEIDHILQGHFKQFNGYSNKRLLFEAVKITLPLFLNDNGFKDEDAILSVAKHLFADKYVFYDLHIWQSEPEYSKSVSGLTLGFGRAKGGVFTSQEVDEYFIKLKLSPNLTHTLRINKGKDNFVLYDEGKILLTEHINLSQKRVSAIFTELQELFDEQSIQDAGFVVLRDIASEWYARLPLLEHGIKWTPLLLQETILRFPERGFKIIMSGLGRQSIYTTASAITTELSACNTFSDIVHFYLLRKPDFELPRRMPSEELRLILRDAGIIGKNELVYIIHKALGHDHRFAFTENNQTVLVRER